MNNMVDRTLTADEVVRMMGGPVAAATTLGIKHSSVCRWVREDRIPVDRVPSVAKVTGLPRWKLPHQRPDLFPKR